MRDWQWRADDDALIDALLGAMVPIQVPYAARGLFVSHSGRDDGDQRPA